MKIDMIMNKLISILTASLLCLMASCSNENSTEGDKLEDKGFQVNSASEIKVNDKSGRVNNDTIKLETRPNTVLFTGIPSIRITSIFKVNIKKKDNTTFIGSNGFHYNDEEEVLENNWNGNIMPGIEATYGYNMVNISHYNTIEMKQKLFFETPVLVKTLYYPSYSQDTLNNKPIKRDYFMVSVYNEDTNKDGFVNLQDLRRFYLFNSNGEKQGALVPENYSVLKSEYDPENDYMYVFAKIDANNNGIREEYEAIHVFWIDLKDPLKTGRMY